MTPNVPGSAHRVLSNLSWISWHLLSAVCIPLALSELRIHEHMWTAPYTWQLFCGGLALVHLLVAAAVSWTMFRRGAAGLLTVGAAVALCHGAFFLALELSGIEYSRAVLVSAAGASFVVTTMSIEMTPVLNRVLLPAMLISSVAMVRVSFAGWPADALARSTTFVDVKLVNGGRIPSDVSGGALEAFDAGLLAAAGDGGLYYVDGTGAGGGTVQRLPYEIPVNRNAFVADRPANVHGNDPFRVTDILVDNLGDRFRLFASHHYWRSQDRCIGIRVSVTEALRAAFLNGTAQVRWRTLYESHPCLPLGEIRFSQSGGRMVKLDAATLLLTVGDHSLDGFYARTSGPQDPGSQYGKTVRIDLQSGAASVYSLGHRNAQGLYRSPDGMLWLTEQGPSGGDELNLLAEGANFGWPLVTYGAAYGMHTWPLNAHDGRHAGYVAPVFAWVPSIAVTSVLGIQSDLVPAWQGDLLVASLRGHVIRLRVDGERVAFAEPIYSTGTRIRDMAEVPDGRIALYQDGGSISFILPLPGRADSDPEPAMSGHN